MYILFNQTLPQGIHNVFVVIPQFIVNGISAIVFAISEPSHTVAGSRDARKIGISHSLSRAAMESQGERTFDSIGFVFRYELVHSVIAFS